MHLWVYKNKILKKMSFLLEEELDKALENVNATAPATVAKEKKKRKAVAVPRGNLREKVRKVTRHTKTSNFAKEIRKLQKDSGDALKNAQPVDGRQIMQEIRDAEARATKSLEELDQLLRVGENAIQQTAKYANLISRIEQHSHESQVLDKVLAVFTKFITAASNARESCTRIPREFADMLVKTDLFMRASSSSLVPTGMGVFVDAANGQLATKNSHQSIVTFSGPRSSNTFKLVSEEASRADISALENSYLATSMLNSNFDPRMLSAAKSSAQRDAQRQAALLSAGNEVTPALYGSEQYRKLQESIGAVARNALPAPERLAIE